MLMDFYRTRIVQMTRMHTYPWKSVRSASSVF